MDQSQSFLSDYEQLMRTRGLMFDPNCLRTGVDVVPCTGDQVATEMRRLRTKREQTSEAALKETPAPTRRSKAKAEKASDPESPAE